MPLVDQYDGILFDLDGVLYRGDRPVGHAAEAIAELRAAGRGLAFVTNNSSRTAEEIADALGAFGIHAQADEIVTSAIATASLIAARGGGTAFVIGETGIRDALNDAGIRVLEGEPTSADWVVVGWDRSADYARLRTAALLVQRGAKLIGTNADASYPAPDGLWPGAGALLAVVTTTTGAEPEVVGKPHPPLFENARQSAGGGSALFVGDRLDTDVAGAAAVGLDSLLVLTGVSRPPDVLRADTLPTYLGRDLRTLFMDVPRVRAATDEDVGPVVALLRAAGLDEEGTAERIETTLVAALDGGRGIVGTVTLELDSDVACLRSLAVDERCRGVFIGTLLTAHAVRHARQAGARTVFLVTETAEGFFASLGFDRAGTLDALPAVFRERLSLCSDSAAVMRIAL